MSKAAELFQKAKHSARALRLLNFGLSRMIPFNQPHGFKVLEVSDNHVKTLLPYKKKNFNHIKGLHACALATVSEFTTGLMLISRLDSKEYRIIMQKMEMEYFYQGKMDATGEFKITEEWLNNEIIEPLKGQESIVVPCEIKIHDVKGNHLTTGMIYWQVKAWSKVKTKVA